MLLMENPAVKIENLLCLLGFHMPHPVQDFFHQPMCKVFSLLIPVCCIQAIQNGEIQLTICLFHTGLMSSFFSVFWLYLDLGGLRCFLSLLFRQATSEKNPFQNVGEKHPEKKNIGEGGLIWWPVLSNPSS